MFYRLVEETENIKQITYPCNCNKESEEWEKESEKRIIKIETWW